MDTYTSLKSEEFTLFEVEELGIRKPSAAKKQGSKGYIRTKGFFFVGLIMLGIGCIG
jgi:hypothetical protein